MMRLNIVSVALLGLATAAAQANPILTYKSQDWKDKCQDEPITDGWPSNNTVNLHPDVGTSSIWRSSMTDGAEAWHAGSGYRLPGADIDVHIHNTRTVPATLVDGLNDILFVSYNTEQFEDLGLSSRRARARIEA